MPRELDYARIESLINTVISTKKNGIDRLLFDPPDGEKYNCNYKKNIIEAQALYSKINSSTSLQNFLFSDIGWVPIDVFIILYIHLHRSESSVATNYYKDILAELDSDPLYESCHEIREQFRFYELLYQLLNKKISWPEFTYEFDAKDWRDIHLLMNVLPLSNTTISEFLTWISKIIIAQQKDISIGGLSKQITDWILHGNGVKILVDDDILSASGWPNANRFLFAILKGAKQKQGHETTYYIKLLEPIMHSETYFPVLNAIGHISTENELDDFIQLLVSRLEIHQLPIHEFIRLCCDFNLYREDIYKRIHPAGAYSDNLKAMQSLIEYLQHAPDNIEESWLTGAASFVIALPQGELKRSLDLLLFQLAKNNKITLCYKLLDIRIEKFGREAVLETGLSEMIRKNIGLFHEHIVFWLTHDNPEFQQVVFEITSKSNLDKNYFAIPQSIFESLNSKNKVYAGYKIAGYIYSMEILQGLFISLVKSVKEYHEYMKEAFQFILNEYIVYNYRSTLELLRKDLRDNQLPTFARLLFQNCVNHFEDYFIQLRGVSIKKEITPYTEQNQLINFYKRKLYADIPKKARQQSISRLFKQTDINASLWAIRRPNEYKHTTQPLGRFSVTSEFPSGEKLNPIYQEHIRRTYQKIMKDEINID